MGFPNDICGNGDGEAGVTWSSFLGMKSLCSLTTLGAAASFLAALLTFCAVLALWSSSPTGSYGAKRNYQEFTEPKRDSGWDKPKKGGDDKSVTDSSFAPAMNTEDRSDDEYDYEEDEEGESEESYARRRGRGAMAKQGKKGTGVHWLKLLLYWTQAAYHIGEGALDIGDADPDDPYKYVSYVILVLAWTVHCGTECVHHSLMSRRHNPVCQVFFPALAFGSATWILARKAEFRGVGLVEPATWDLGLLLMIVFVEIWSCIRTVRVKYYEYLTPEYSAGLWSLLNFNWYTRVIDLGYKGELKKEDLPELVDDDRAKCVWRKYSKLLYPRGRAAVRDGEELNVGASILRLAGKRFYLQVGVSLFGVMTELIAPLSLNKITVFMDTYDSEAEHEGIPLIVVASVAGLFLGQAVANYCNTAMFKFGRRLGIRSRAALVSAVFRKAMVLDISGASAGQLQNLISVDAEAVLNLMVFQMFMWGAVVRLVSCIVLLFWVLGLSAMCGLSLIFLSVPLNKMLVGRLKRIQGKLMKRKDERMSVVGESMNGIRVIKLFAWEPKFVAKMIDHREVEMVLLRTYMFILGCTMVVVKSSPTLIGLITFLFHTKVLGHDLTAATGFTALALFNQIRMPLTSLPETVNHYIQARVSFRRVEGFLRRSADDVNSSQEDGKPGSDRRCPDLARGQLKIENGTFRWRQAQEHSKPTLTNINLDVQPRNLVCVYGATGSGKSSLLMAFLREIETIEGKSLINGSVAYASQSAWILNATVRDNILFGCAYDAGRYEMVLNACALQADLEILDAGDQTEIGEKGVNLSGGQQQRVSLARAVYADTDIVLLDDVLSAVDAHVGKHIFDKCIRKVLKLKTVVLVTHQVTMSAPYADRIVVVDSDGTIKEQGTYEELSSQGEGHLVDVIKARGKGAKRLLRKASTASTMADDKDAKEPSQAETKTIIELEKRAVGGPKASLFTTYFQYCGGLRFGVAWAILSVVWQGLTIAQSFTLKTWINQMSDGEKSGSGMWLYISISLASFVALLARTVLITSGSLRASRTVHHEMATTVFGAPVAWFDVTPLGRIFNRFSSDVVTLDKDLMNHLCNYSDMLLGVTGVVVVIATAIPMLTVAMIPILFLCCYYANRYLQTSRQLKRLEAVNRSPLYAHFSETVSGLASIRAYKAEGRFIAASEHRVNRLNRVHFSLWCSNFWLTNRVRMIGAAVCGLAGGFLVAAVARIDGSTAGIVLTYSLNFTMIIVFTVRLHAQMEMSANSIERLDEYCKLPQEAPAVVEGRRPPANWPSAGEVDIKNLTLKYASSNEPVLHDLTFYVPPRTRVGIVGRTGAGKSSLMNALFRIVEPMPGSSVVVDGEDILKMGLQDLRRRLAIIPQDPTLFEGTVRSNVDPFDDYNDSEVWDALRQCRMHRYVSSQERRLQHAVSSGGSNLSVGQRQLLCMARALLRRAGVLVMDEATANVDPATDALIQEAMKEGFGGCTILCIAHRLDTVAFYDRVLVLDQGEVAEYDTPLALLDNPDSDFRSMCEKTGDLERLRRVAEESFNNASKYSE